MKSPSRRVLVLLSAVTAGVLVAGTAYAAIPRSSTPELVACMNNTTGAVRMADTTRGRNCNDRRETTLPSGAFGGGAAPAVPESAIRDAVDRAVEQALASAGTPRGGVGRLTSLDELEGLPCNVGKPDQGVVRIRYGRPQAGSSITMVCLSGSTVTTFPVPTTTSPPSPTTYEPPPSPVPPTPMPWPSPYEPPAPPPSDGPAPTTVPPSSEPPSDESGSNA